MANVVKNYIEALYDSINNTAERNQLEKDLKDFVNLYNSNNELKKVLVDPRFEDKVKFEIIEEVISKKQKLLLNFIKLLISEKRINLIEEMLLEYEIKNRTFKKELSIKIVVSSEIDELQIDKIIEKFKKLYKVNTVKYSIEIDKNILGGIKVIVDNTVYDGSIKRQLAEIF